MNPMILFSVLVAVGLASLYFGVVRFTRNTGPRWGECVALVAMGIFLLWILVPNFNAAQEKSREVICSEHLERLATGLFMYSQDHKEYLPQPAVGWILLSPTWGISACSVARRTGAMRGIVTP